MCTMEKASVALALMTFQMNIQSICCDLQALPGFHVWRAQPLHMTELKANAAQPQQ